MLQIVDKLILILICSTFLTGMGLSFVPVIVLLIAVCTAGLGIAFEGKSKLWLVSLGFTVGCLFCPELVYFLPVMLYDCFKSDYKVFYVLSLFVLFFQKDNYTILNIILLVLFIVVSYILSGRTEKIKNLEKEMIRFRDTSTELNLALKEKNKNLMEKQDYEVYLATLSERNRIAKEIHDNVGHMLSRSILQVGAISTLNKDESLFEHLDSVKETLNTAMSNIRESVHDLHDDSIDLEMSVREAAKELESICQVDIDYDMSRDVPKKIKYCFISIIKEGISNIIKHSDASRVQIILREHPGLFQLLIEDNGHVSNTSLVGGIGIDNIKERVNAFNGTVHFNTDNGFRIFVSINKGEEVE